MDSDKKKEYNKAYYTKHKDKIKQYLATKVECEICKRTVSKNHLQIHLGSNICKKWATKTLLISKIKDDIHKSFVENNQIKV
jgi:hypothetical protein